MSKISGLRRNLEVRRLSHDAFTRYAARYWHEHFGVAGKERSDLIKIAKRFFKAGNESFNRWARYVKWTETGALKVPEQDLRIGTPLYYTACYDITSLIDGVQIDDPLPS